MENFKKAIENNVKFANYEEVKRFIHAKLNCIPINLITVDVNKNTYIERAVKISKSDQPFGIDRLSYIPKNLTHIVKEGRFNKTKEPTFYGSFTDLQTPSSTRYFLATEIDHSLLGKKNQLYHLTLTKWLSKDSFKAAFMVFDQSIGANDLMKSVIKDKLNSNTYKLLSSELKMFLKLLTLEISKPNSIHKYKITNYIFDYFKERDYQAIVYPGIRSKYRGNNIAMLPEITDDFWEVKFGAEFCLEQKENSVNIENVYFINVCKEGNTLEYRDIEPEEEGKRINIPK